MQSLDKCGAIPNKDIDCLKSKCPLWDRENNMCVLDISSTMIASMETAITLLSKKWLSMDNNQRLNAGLGIAKKLGIL